MTDLVRAAEALPSIARARVMLEQCRTTGEVVRIKALAQAVASCAESERTRDEAAAIVLFAKARIGELTAALPQATAGNPNNRRGGRLKVRGADNKSSLLKAEGISRQEASECERIAALKASGDLDRVIAKGARPTAAGAVALARMPEPQREKAIAKLGDLGDVRKAIGEVKLEAKRALADEIRANPVVTPDARYQVIAIDPPWKYDKRAEDTTHRGKNLYPEMTVDEICALPVADRAQRDCVLWLWTTNAFMRGAYRCLDAWGFEEKTILTWDKVAMGLGDWLRNVTEHCILAVRGAPVVSLTNQTTIIREARREHSRKPKVFYELVDQLCPGSKLEMFAREEREGWTAWGAETGKFKVPQ